jgi:hypothetical protein
MSTEDPTQALQRWLESPPGTKPPAELEPDVVQAIYALRPERAPAPRVTADDILASITEGPLANRARAPTSRGGDVVAFPGSTLPELDETTGRSVEAGPVAPLPPRRSPWRWVGGASGLGLLAAAAASVVLLVLPDAARHDPAAPVSSTFEAEPAPSPATATGPAAADPAASQAAPAPDAKADPGPADDLQQRSVPAAEPIAAVEEAPPAEIGAASGARAEGVYEMDGAGRLRDRAGIPELAADEEASGELEALGYLDPSGWRAVTDPKTQVHVDLVLAEAAQLATRGDLRGAGARAAQAVEPPVRAGQYAAWMAARYYLDAGAPRDAEKIARRGLELSADPSPERDQLQAVYDLARRRR